jgi:hypothetical protein
VTSSNQAGLGRCSVSRMFSDVARRDLFGARRADEPLTPSFAGLHDSEVLARFVEADAVRAASILGVIALDAVVLPEADLADGAARANERNEPHGWRKMSCVPIRRQAMRS